MNEATHQLAPPAPTPGELSASFAAPLAMTKQHLASLAEGDRIPQTGCAYIGEEFVVPDLSGRFGSLDEPIIETFIVEADGACTPTGTDQALIDAMTPLAEEMAGRTLSALSAVGVELESPGYLTASVSPVEQVTHLAHFDDDLYVPNDGVGAVAIAGSGNGPRLGRETVSHQPLRPGLPVEVSEALIDGFGEDPSGVQRATSNRIVVFPQFGQLHSGPGPDELLDGEQVRTLLVFRLSTRPSIF